MSLVCTNVNWYLIVQHVSNCTKLDRSSKDLE
jgi:hypothetical protein